MEEGPKQKVRGRPLTMLSCCMSGRRGFACVSRLACLTIFILVFAIAVFAQEPDDIAPPPLKLLSKTERADLASKTEPKDHTNLALQMMDTRLRSAEKYRTDENYSLMYAELGSFQALMDNALDFLLKSHTNEGRRLSSLKKYEIGLREFSPRIEGLRRELPYNFDPYLKALVKSIVDAREKAMEPFFSNNVVSNT